MRAAPFVGIDLPSMEKINLFVGLGLYLIIGREGNFS
jgi:hypothetical protein